MAKREFESANDALKHINKKSGITVSGKIIKLEKKAVVSISMWGALDYLKKKHNYIVNNENSTILG